MTAVEKARRFLQQKSRTIALTAVPLAALVAVSAPRAKASVVFAGTTCSSTVSGGTASGASCLITQLPEGPNFNTGISMTGNGSVTTTLGGFLGVQFVGSGAFSGSFNGSIPVAWSFNLTDPSVSVSNPIQWQISLTMTPTSGSASFFQSGSAITSGTVTGSGSALFSGVTGPGSYTLRFEADVLSASGGEQLSVAIPSGSIDINAIGAAPEPSTWSMIVSAGAGLLWWRRRRRRS